MVTAVAIVMMYSHLALGRHEYTTYPRKEHYKKPRVFCISRVRLPRYNVKRNVFAHTRRTTTTSIILYIDRRKAPSTINSHEDSARCRDRGLNLERVVRFSFFEMSWIFTTRLKLVGIETIGRIIICARLLSVSPSLRRPLRVSAKSYFLQGLGLQSDDVTDVFLIRCTYYL